MGDEAGETRQNLKLQHFFVPSLLLLLLLLLLSYHIYDTWADNIDTLSADTLQPHFIETTFYEIVE
jgi:hypothetical protein